MMEKALEGKGTDARSDVPTTWGLTWKDPHPDPGIETLHQGSA